MPDKILKIDLWVRVMVPTYSGGIINEPHISLDLELKVKLLGSVMQMLTHTSILKWRTTYTHKPYWN